MAGKGSKRLDVEEKRGIMCCFFLVVRWMEGSQKERGDCVEKLKEEVVQEEKGWGEEEEEVPGHQLSVGRKRREERRSGESGEGGREQHRTSRGNIGGA